MTGIGDCQVLMTGIDDRCHLTEGKDNHGCQHDVIPCCMEQAAQEGMLHRGHPSQSFLLATRDFLCLPVFPLGNMDIVVGHQVCAPGIRKGLCMSVCLSFVFSVCYTSP